MLTDFEIDRARRLIPSGFDYLDFRDEDFTRAFLACYSDDHPVTIILAPGGCGKSEIYRAVAEHYKDDALCLASTGRAATNLETPSVIPRTVHSGLGLSISPYYDENGFYKKAIDALNRKSILLIDEVSMLSSNTLDVILRCVSFVNKYRHGKKLKVVLMGDDRQLQAVFDRQSLAPVIRDNPNLENEWQFLNSKELAKIHPQILTLKRVFRQSDANYKNILARCRLGIVSSTDLTYINKHVGKASEKALIIASTNDEVDKLNSEYLAKLAETKTPYEFKADVLVDGRIRDSNYSQSITLYESERVCITRNLYDDHQLLASNGTCGYVEYFIKTESGVRPVVRTDSGLELTIPKLQFVEKELKKDEKGKYVDVVVASANQIPLKAAHAMTVHKVQGMSLDNIHIIPPYHKAQPGSMYTALSRVRSPEGLTLERPVTAEMFVSLREKALTLNR